jgi:hypothetical protein
MYGVASLLLLAFYAPVNAVATLLSDFRKP